MTSLRGWLALGTLSLLACASEPDGTSEEAGVVARPAAEPDDDRTTAASAAPDAPKAAPGGSSGRCVADATLAVRGLPEKGALEGFHLAGFADPTLFKHWEGVQRLDAKDGAWLAVSRIGTEMFDIVAMGSRDGGGAAFGANRTSEGRAPPETDRIVASIPEDAGFDHAGGMQVLGDLLAVPLENGTRSRVVFYDVSSPAKPIRRGVLERPTVGEAGTASLAALPDGRVLLVVGRKGAQTLDVLVSKTPLAELDKIETSSFVPSGTWRVADGVGTTLDGDKNFGDYQNLNLIPQCDGKLFLLGTHREGTLVGTDFVDLFAFSWSPKIELTKVAKRRVQCDGQCNMDAAAGAYLAPDGKLRVYATEHDNDGPSGSIKMREF